MQHSMIQPNEGATYSPNPAQKDMGAIIAKYSDLVSRIAWHVHSRMSSSIEVADLIQIGMIALIEGARNFEERGVDFAAYASTRIRGAMIDELRREAKISRSGIQNGKRIAHAKDQLSHSLGRPPLPNEIADELGVDIFEYFELESSAAALKQESMDDAYSDYDIWFADLSADPFDQLDRAKTSQRLAEAISELPERQAKVLQLYFIEELNLEEIGCIIGVGAARVCQIKQQALSSLKKKWDAN